MIEISERLEKHKTKEEDIILRIKEALRGVCDLQTEEENLLEPSRIMIGDRFIQIGDWRIGDADGTHFSITHFSTRDHSNGSHSSAFGQYTAVIFRKDGTVHNGPRTSCGCAADQLTTWNR